MDPWLPPTKPSRSLQYYSPCMNIAQRVSAEREPAILEGNQLDAPTDTKVRNVEKYEILRKESVYSQSLQSLQFF